MVANLTAESSADADLTLVHDDELAAQAKLGEARNRPPKHRIDGFLDRRMKAESHDTRRPGRGIPEHVRKIRVECQEHPILCNRCATHVPVVSAREPDFYYGNGIVAQIADGSNVKRRQILVQ